MAHFFICCDEGHLKMWLGSIWSGAFLGLGQLTEQCVVRVAVHHVAVAIMVQGACGKQGWFGDIFYWLSCMVERDVKQAFRHNRPLLYLLTSEEGARGGSDFSHPACAGPAQTQTCPAGNDGSAMA